MQRSREGQLVGSFINNSCTIFSGSNFLYLVIRARSYAHMIQRALSKVLQVLQGGCYLKSFSTGLLFYSHPLRAPNPQLLPANHARNMAAAGRNFSVIHEKMLHCRFVCMCPTMDLVASLHADGQLSVHRWVGSTRDSNRLSPLP